MFAARTSPECWQSSDALPHGSLWGRHSRSSVIGKILGGRSLRASWREDLAEGPRARMDAGAQRPAGRTARLRSALQPPCLLPCLFLSSQAILIQPQTCPCSSRNICSFPCPAPRWSFPSGARRRAGRAAFRSACSILARCHLSALLLAAPLARSEAA